MKTKCKEERKASFRDENRGNFGRWREVAVAALCTVGPCLFLTFSIPPCSFFSNIHLSLSAAWTILFSFLPGQRRGGRHNAGGLGKSLRHTNTLTAWLVGYIVAVFSCVYPYNQMHIMYVPTIEPQWAACCLCCLYCSIDIHYITEQQWSVAEAVCSYVHMLCSLRQWAATVLDDKDMVFIEEGLDKSSHSLKCCCFNSV